ncbi:hypothetical protein UlMin_040290 [Ulmus minor]
MKVEKQSKKGLWTEEEDRVLMEYIKMHGIGKWNRIPKVTGLKRCGKSCRLRWLNYLSPGVKRGCFSEEEDDLIIRLHKLLGNRWSLIAGRVPGRTDNQVKNHWNTHLRKKLGIKNQTRRKVMDSGKEHQLLNVDSNSGVVEVSEMEKIKPLNDAGKVFDEMPQPEWQSPLVFNHDHFVNPMEFLLEESLDHLLWQSF